jgi:hypothetical protein
MAKKSRTPRIKGRPKIRALSKLPKIISLFSGAGGLDHGFKAAGFKISAAFDISKAAIETHRRNFPNSIAIADDLIRLGPVGVLNAVKKTLRKGSRIGIIGGPPCQGFSRANTTATDPRNELPTLYVDIVRELQPIKLDECELATKVVNAIYRLVDVDEILASDSGLRDEMIDSTCALLEPARYNPEAYRKWAVK